MIIASISDIKYSNIFKHIQKETIIRSHRMKLALTFYRQYTVYTVRKKKLEKLFESGGLVIPHHSRQAHSRNSHIFVTFLNSTNVQSMQDTTPNHFQQFLYIALLRMGFLCCILPQFCLLLYKRISLKCESIFLVLSELKIAWSKGNFNTQIWKRIRISKQRIIHPGIMIAFGVTSHMHVK